LNRYGYLPNPKSDPPGLPVGFTVSNAVVGATGMSGQVIGMTCAACHTRQIEVAGTAYRIDGGPAIVDFQSFLADLDAAVKNVLDNAAAFTAFAKAVIGPKPTPAQLGALRKDVQTWHLPYHTLIQRSLPTPAWGPSRLDAVSMIFNRVTGLDIGPPPTYIIADNIKRADAPVRYPFLWNAPIQDATQWPGFASNGSPILGLGRNVGEVFGVFAAFKPKKDLFLVSFLKVNSANFSGLNALEELVRKIGPPKWQWPVDAALASQGQQIFERSTETGGCVACHGITPGPTRFPDYKTWSTPIQDVKTDSREHGVLNGMVTTGVLEGTSIPFLSAKLKPTDLAKNVLATAVLGTILEHYLDPLSLIEGLFDSSSGDGKKSSLHPSTLAELKGSYQFPASTPKTVTRETTKKATNTALTSASAPAPTPQVYAYESRVLQGIWAAAPYLHNGSVQSLAELLKPASERASEFKLGPNYDIENVGLAAEQSKFNYTLKTTDCTDRNSGNSRCGHEFGTSLPAADKRALLEYLKTL
jgi:cytochrome c553